MNVIDVDRVKTIANFMEEQIGEPNRPGPVGVAPTGPVCVSDEDAAIVIDTLREYVLRELALGNDRAGEWDTLRGFFRRHGTDVPRPPACLVCEQHRPATKIRPRELPRIVVCDVCRAKALTADITITTDGQGRAVAVVRTDEEGRPLSVLWKFQNNPSLKREERVHADD